MKRGSKLWATTWKHMRRTPYQALAASLVMTLTLFVAAVVTLVTLGSEGVLKYFETRPQVTAFFADTAAAEQIDNLKNSLVNSDLVAGVNFISKEEALAIYREQNKNDPLLLEMVTAQILPASLEISAKKAEDLPKVAELIEGAAGVEEVVYQPDLVAAVTRWTRALRIGGGILLGFFALVAGLTIVIIIGMRVAGRKEEIDILKLLGASNWQIRGPFILEGAVYGLVGAVVAWGAAYILLLYATPFLVEFLGNIPLLPVSVGVMLMLLAAEVGGGLAIGVLGSLVALSRFMRS